MMQSVAWFVSNSWDLLQAWYDLISVKSAIKPQQSWDLLGVDHHLTWCKMLCLLGNEKCDCQFDFVNICFSSSKHEGHSFTNWNTEWRAAVAEQVFIRSENKRWPFARPEHCNQCSDNAGIVCDLSQFMINMSYCVVVPSVLWHCWLGFRKSIWPVKDRVMRWWRGYLSEVRCMICIWSSWCHCYPIIYHLLHH